MKSKRSAQHKLTIGVSPVYSPKNPYQYLLRKELEAQSFIVHDFRTSTILLRRIIRQRKIDILHLHWTSPFFIRKTQGQSWFRGLIFLAKLCVIRLAGIKIVWTLHNLRDHEEAFPALSHIIRKIIAKLASAIIVHSKIANEAVCKDFGTSISKKLHVIPHGHFIDCYPNQISKAEARKKLGLSDNQFIYLFFGAIREYKGVDQLINAFKLLNNSATTLVIAGRARDEQLDQKIFNLCRDNDNILLNSTFIKPENVQDYMNACDVVVFPYRKILTSGAVILAMSFGRACVAPKIGSIPDVLDENGAFLYEEANEQQLLKAIQDAFKNARLTEQFGMYNRNLAKQWQWNEISKMTAKIYRGVLNR